MELLIENMLGRHISEKGLFLEVNHEINETILDVKDIKDYKNKVLNISFNLKKGEVISIAGIKGSGKEELPNDI